MSHQSFILTQTRKNFRNRLRRQQIQNYFSSRRSQALRQLQLNIQDNSIYDQQSRIQFLQNIRKQLSQSQPSPYWQTIISILDQHLFKFKNNFQLWIYSSMKNKYCHLSIQSKIMKMFAKIILYCKNQQNVRLYSYFFNQNYVQDYIIYQKSTNLPVEEALQFLRFYSNLSCISANIRNTLLQTGVFQIIQNIGDNILCNPYQFNQQIILNYLGYISQFLQVFTSNNKKSYPQINFGLMIIYKLSQFINLKFKQKIINQCLFCFVLILKQNKFKLYQPFLKSQQTLSTLFQFLQCKSLQQKALLCINSLSVQQNHSKYKFRDMNIYSFLYDITTQQNIKKSIKILICSIIYNLVYNQEQAQILINDPIWKIIISYISQSNQYVQQQAIYCLNNALNLINNYQIIRSIFSQIGLIPTIIQQIVICKQKKYKNCGLLIQTIDYYIKAYALQDSENNQAWNRLYSIYHFLDILQQIYQDSKSSQLVDQVERMIDVIVNRYTVNL